MSADQSKASLEDGSAGSTPRIFISYRREDSAAHAGRLYDALVQRFGSAQVFTDVYAISAGEEFEKIILNSLSNTTVMIAVIGPKWRGRRGWLRRRRIWNEDDWIRRELEIAHSASVAILPVLVAGASLPETRKLPESLSFLHRIQTFSLRDDRWNDDVSAFARAVESAHVKRTIRPKELHTAPVTTHRTTRISKTLVVGAGGLMTLALIALIPMLFGYPEGIFKGPETDSNTNGNSSPSIEASALPINANVSPSAGLSTPDISNTNTTGPVVPSLITKVGLVNKSPATDESIDIGFMNLKMFTDQVDETRVDNVTTALTDLNLDVIGITEVQKGSVDRLITNLTKKGHPVNYVFVDASGPQDLALIYRRDRIQCALDDNIYTSHRARLDEREPASGALALPRPPLFAFCSSARLKSPINVVVVHFKSKYGGGTTNERQRQLASVILGEIISNSQRQTVVGGDFNSEPEEALRAFNGLANVGGLRPLFDINPAPPSFIGSKAYQGLIDHIWVSSGLTIVPIDNAASVVVALDQVMPDYIKQVSDHRPIVVRFAYEQ